uniref:AlNc14C91G5695 protein n=1 Tax=Albugo laibachii Nc14 TaxID=890382 RepID=F0WGG2_9STRA|nr:AlNc14C91G5695 [Albugo laibachii Nc14]|eukprot:CCA20325.1 AlNc14C91G5695 [Albugo laibachii Nc14]
MDADEYTGCYSVGNSHSRVVDAIISLVLSQEWRIILCMIIAKADEQQMCQSILDQREAMLPAT